MEMPLVLVVEDEDLITMMIEDALADSGFEVATASSGAKALAYLEGDGSPVALVTDVRLGDISGWAVAKHAREKLPNIAIVYVTGDSAIEWPAKGVPGSVCIQKPFAGAQLVTAIASQLNAAPPAP